MQRLCFIDIDGVLNSIVFFAKTTNKRNKPENDIDPEAVKRLNRLIREGRLEAVLSSTWRTLYSMDEMQKFLARRGFKSKLVGRTPDLSNSHGPDARGDEILHYITRLDKAPAAAVILDDVEPMGKMTPLTVYTDEAVGLTDRDVDLALALIEEQMKRFQRGGTVSRSI
jgi:hypothetical protein